MATLHYLFDPYCGWCYAASPLVAAARSLPGLALQLHAGGMLTGTRRRQVTPQWRDYVLPHDQRIGQLTGQPFGAAYLDGLLRREDIVLDSGPPSAAVLAAVFLGGRGAQMLAALQAAHFVDGRLITEADVLADCAAAIGLDVARFRLSLQACSGPSLERHFGDTLRLMSRAGAQGFPTFLLEAGEGRVRRLDPARWLGQPDGWQEHLASLVAAPRGQALAAAGGQAP